MGEMADYLLNGDDCQSCGAYIGEGDGFPQNCSACGGEEINTLQVSAPKFSEFHDQLEHLNSEELTCTTYTAWHYSITQKGTRKRLDLFPKHHRYHDVRNNVRGSFNLSTLAERIQEFFKEKPEDNLL